MIYNGDFELGGFGFHWSRGGSCMVIGEEQFTGDYCARLEGKDSYIEQIVTGLQPNTSYILTAKVKSQFKKQYVILGVKDFGGTDLNTSANSTEYIKLTLIFRTGKENESAKIYIKSLNNGYCYVDDISLYYYKEPAKKEKAAPSIEEEKGFAQLPKPPKSYQLPSEYILVDNTEAFIKAFKSTVPQNIVLEEGVYVNTTSVTAGAPHKIWARSLGGAVLKFGLKLRGDGSEVHGICFDGNKDEAMIFIEENNPNSKIYDCWFNGNRKVAKAIEARETNGLVVKRCIIKDFTEYGLYWQAYYPKYLYDTPEIPPIIEDCDISGIYQTVRGSMNGTGECGLWAATECTVNRVRIRDTGWMGLWTGANCNNAIFSNITIDNCYKDDNHSIGIYVEHWTRNCIFKNLQIGPISGAPRLGHRMDIGITTEWDDPNIMPNPVIGQNNGANHNNTFENAVINSRLIGINLEDSENTTIRNMKFINQSQYAIRDHDSNGTGYSTILEESIDFKDIANGCIEYIQD
ncbi:MAG: hypothetical protein GX206_06135 [Clostridiales bacterium]|nr:hypothetical protein [Clostridiales bacterium]